MKKITNRAVSVLLIAAMVICGLVVYVLRYVDDGQRWALYFAAANSGSEGRIYDRDGEMLVTLSPLGTEYSPDELTRMACYHVTGDYWGRTGTGVLSGLIDSAHGFNLVTGTTRAEDIDMPLTVDAGLCRAAYQALGQESKGAAMVMNYKTGEILCMVSLPCIDPALSEIEEPGEGAYINRCISASFIPGSVFKLITSAAAIENIPDIYEKSFYCEGIYTIAGVDITCSGTHYTQTFEQALANSCNCAFARIAVMLGQETMIEYVEKYGFLSSHEIDGIATAAGSYPLDFVGDPELAWSGIGQSTDLVCPFSLLRLVAATANGGVLATPHIIGNENPGSGVLMDSDTADKLSRMMDYNVIAHYGGSDTFPGLNICAKTGTAELGDGSSHAWFTGFLDDEAHPYAFVVLIEQGGGGLSVAGAAANDILQYAVTME